MQEFTSGRLAFDPGSSRYLAVARNWKTSAACTVHDLQYGKESALTSKTFREITSLNYSPTGKWLAVAGIIEKSDAFSLDVENLIGLRVCETQHNQTISRINMGGRSGPADGVDQVLFLEDSSQMVVREWSWNRHLLKVLDLRSGTVTRRLMPPSDVDKIFDMDASPDGRLLVCLAGRRTILLFNLETGLLDRTIRRQYELARVSFVGDRQLLLVSHEGNQVRVWRLSL